ncbi:Uma2 family endonuclease [filamentous cyanobacterium LEGE 11480]|uniref:Uma2 family endonuclease n=1 Tax=Romeriopsis navalis LEGE 11480 TaxID=2777977 RepID=A0A928Z282_9CYAN|nr:Uma2 family endonuclease [Romeriopsis navalis]MBE9028772.1 Uma2 family endonuclease [Romeriopsis navalis LEGE 11480]
MVQTPIQPISLAAFLDLPETKPASEYVDGAIIQKPMPKGKHSRLQGRLTSNVNNTLEAPKIAISFPELRCTFGGRSTVPDIAVFTWDRIPQDETGDIANTFDAAPDWTIEILSPEQSPTKVTKNILHCLKNDCAMGWLIDPDDRSVVVYPAGQQAVFFDEPEQVIQVPDFASAMQLTIGELFGWLQI